MKKETAGNGRLAVIVITWLGCMIGLVAVAVLLLLRVQGAGLALASGLVGGAAVGCCIWAYSRWLSAREKWNPVWSKESRALLENQRWCVVQEDGEGLLRRVSVLFLAQETALKLLEEWRQEGVLGLSLSGRYFSDGKESHEYGELIRTLRVK